jgi:hypothetical protein
MSLAQSWQHRGKQFSRSGCAFAPACGSEAWPLADVFGMAEAMPFPLCLSKLFAQSSFIPGGFDDTP